MSEKLWYKVWPEKVPKTVKVPEIAYHEVLRENARKYPSKPALIFENKIFTFKDLDEQSDKVANFLVSLGLKKDDCVALVMSNCPEWLLSFFGASKAGLRTVIIDPITMTEDLLFQLTDSNSKVLFTDKDVYSREKETIKKSGINYVVLADEKIGETLFFDEILEKYEAKAPDVKINPKEDVVMVLYYAGIAGRTEQVYHTHYGTVATGLAISTFLEVTEKDVGILALQASHLLGFDGCIVICMHTGATMVMQKRFEPKQVMQLIKEYEVTFWTGAPLMFDVVAKHPDFSKEYFKSLRWCASGGAPLPVEVQEKFEKGSGAPLLQVYGMTESHLVTITPLTRKVYGSMGIPITNVDAKIVDPKTGTKELKPGEVGELIVKAPTIMKGYISAEDTSKAIRNGWLYTGDLVKMDENGMLYFAGFKKRMIKYKAYPIFPRDLEDILSKHPTVKECLVVGKPTPEVGQIPKAYVVLKPGCEGKVTAEELMNFVNKCVAAYKKLREVEFVKEIPKQ